MLPYHQPTWSGLLSEAYGFRSFVFALVGTEGDVQAGLPLAEVRSPIRRRRWVALPFTDLMPPLLGTADVTEFMLALERAGREAGAASVEIRASVPHPRAHSRADAVCFTPSAWVGTRTRSSPPSTARRLAERSACGSRRCDRSRRRARRRSRTDVLCASRRDPSPARRADPTSPLLQAPLAKGRRCGTRLRPAGRGAGRVARGRGGLLDQPTHDHLPVRGIGLRGLGAAAKPSSLLDGHRSRVRGRPRAGRLRPDGSRGRGPARLQSGWGTVEEPLVYTTLAETPPTEAHGRAAHAVRGILQCSPSIVSRATGALLYRYAA